MKYKYLLLVLSIILCVDAHAGDKVEISAGTGLMELINVGAYYNINNQLQTGIRVGSIPFLESESTFTLTGCFNYYYTGHSEFTQQPTWFLHCGLNYYRFESQKIISDWLFLNLRHGRVFNFSKRFGLKIEAGLGICLYFKETQKYDEYWYEYPDNSASDKLMPNLEIGLFYRF